MKDKEKFCTSQGFNWVMIVLWVLACLVVYGLLGPRLAEAGSTDGGSALDALGNPIVFVYTEGPPPNPPGTPTFVRTFETCSFTSISWPGNNQPGVTRALCYTGDVIQCDTDLDWYYTSVQLRKPQPFGSYGVATVECNTVPIREFIFNNGFE